MDAGFCPCTLSSRLFTFYGLFLGFLQSCWSQRSYCMRFLGTLELQSVGPNESNFWSRGTPNPKSRGSCHRLEVHGRQGWLVGGPGRRESSALGSGLWVEVLGFRALGLALRVMVQGLGFRVWVQGLGHSLPTLNPKPQTPNPKP